MDRKRKIDDEHELVLVAVYADVDTARDDFADLERSLKHGLEVRGTALVTKNEAGEAEVVEAANRHGRIGMGIGAGVGALFGLFAPPLGLSLLVGAATGGLMAAFAEHELRSGLRHEVAQALEAGTAVVISIAYPNGRVPVENTLHHADDFLELTLNSSTIRSVESAIADEMRKLGHPVDESLSAGTTDTSS